MLNSVRLQAEQILMFGIHIRTITRRHPEQNTRGCSQGSWDVGSQFLAISGRAFALPVKLLLSFVSNFDLLPMSPSFCHFSVVTGSQRRTLPLIVWHWDRLITDFCSSNALWRWYGAFSLLSVSFSGCLKDPIFVSLVVQLAQSSGRYWKTT